MLFVTIQCMHIYIYIYLVSGFKHGFYDFHFIYGIVKPSHCRTPSFFKMGTLHHQPVICLIQHFLFFHILGIIIPTDWYICLIYTKTMPAQYYIIPVTCLIYIYKSQYLLYTNTIYWYISKITHGHFKYVVYIYHCLCHSTSRDMFFFFLYPGDPKKRLAKLIPVGQWLNVAWFVTENGENSWCFQPVVSLW